MAQSQYGFQSGAMTQFSKPNNSNKVFVRTDFNLVASNRFTARVNYVDRLAFNKARRRRSPTCCRAVSTVFRTRRCRRSVN